MRHSCGENKEDKVFSLPFLTCLKWLVSTLTNASLIWGVNTRFHHLNVGSDWICHFCLQPTAHCVILESAGKWVWRAGKSLGVWQEEERGGLCFTKWGIFRTVGSVARLQRVFSSSTLGAYFNHWRAEWAKVNQITTALPYMQPLCSDTVNTLMIKVTSSILASQSEHSEQTTLAVNCLPCAVVWFGSTKLCRTLNNFSQ